MQTIDVSADTILDHHLHTFLNNDLEGVMEDYTEESEVWTTNGPIKGLDAIASFFSYVFTLFPKEQTKLELQQRIVQGNKGYIVWKGEGPQHTVPMGTDSFEFRDDKIIWQSAAVLMQPK